MKRLLFISCLLMASSALHSQSQSLASLAPAKVSLAYDYVFEIITHKGDTLKCHEIQAIDTATALLITYKTVANAKGCEVVKLSSYLRLAEIKRVFPINKISHN